MSAGPESKKQLGKILLQQKLVSADTLHEILEEQRRDPSSRLASTAARTGRLSMTDALRALSEQHGVPAADPTEQVVALSTLRFIPVEIARERSVFAFRVEGEKLLLAMSSPDERELIEELEFVTGKKIQPFVGLYEVMRRVIDYAYAALERGEEYYVGAHVSISQLSALGLPDLPRAPEPLSAYPPPPVPVNGEPGAPLPPLRAPIVPEPVRPATEVAAPAPPAVPAAAPAVASGSTQRSIPKIVVPPAVTVMVAAPEPAAVPRAVAPGPAPAAEPAVPAVLAFADASLRAQIVQRLAEQRIAAHETDDGQTALELLLSEMPKLLLIGDKLAGLSGLDLCRKLRASQQYAELPILAIGEHFGDWRLAEDLRENFKIVHCFALPLDLPRLVRTARLVLERRDAKLDPEPLSAAAEAKWNSGMEAFEHGDLDAAIAQLEAGIELEPNAFELQYHLGLLYGRRDDLFGAIRALEVAVRLQSDHFAALKNLAVVYQRVGFRYKAIDAWQRASIAAPDDETRTNIKQHMVSLL